MFTLLQLALFILALLEIGSCNLLLHLVDDVQNYYNFNLVVVYNM